ncbi:IS1182 family transposase [Niallia alba]|uniref:IS1182 family transposase n=1 Tax=Niallia alba TaxID=2729105 RepID=UPI0003328D6C|nr:IS1182 family transposase [Niallia alba]EOR25454.1 transposase IS4 family protein [Niallia nealsonii AAU1]MED3792992.1 IS1182 family transposase [Niallia alba]
MLEKQEILPLSPYLFLYDLVVPKDNMLRQINDLVDFSFILEELTTKYCLDNGRNAIPPIRMFKYLLLKVIFDLSDIDVVERSKYDMSFKYFLDMAPEDPVINPSSLTKFRRMRLQDVALLDLLIGKTVEIAVEKNIITSKTIIVDATHTISRYRNQSPKEYLQEKAKKVRKLIYSFDESLKEKFPTKPTSNDVEEELAYCAALVEVIEQEERVVHIPAIQEKVNGLKEIVEDIHELSSYCRDEDARTGYKSVDHAFHGYKTHMAMSDERIITAAVITSGEQGDGKYLKELVEKTKEAGMNIDTIVGDTAYSGKENLEYTKENKIQLVSKLHPVITNGQPKRKTGFEFNKDANTYACPAGHLATKKAKKGRGKSTQNAQLKYYFDVEKCKVCPFKKGCYKEGAKTKTFSLTIKSNTHLEQEAFQESDEFKTMAKERYKIEAKNSELKNRHGLKKATFSGLFGMQIQGATTIFAVNLKRILKLMNEK